jgi:hypothetical protein
MRIRIPTKGKPKSIGATLIAMAVLAIGAYFFPQQFGKQASKSSGRTSPQENASVAVKPPAFDQTAKQPTENTPTISGDGGIAKLYREKKSNVIVTTGGTIAKVLPDDNETADGSSRHQRFIVRLVTGDTVLISHNIDLADRVPAREGDVIQFSGEYEWTQQGGVVHWTHHDPRNRRPDGWIELRGTRYK